MTIDEMECHLLDKFDPLLLDCAPETEKELVFMYEAHSDILYTYLQHVINPFLKTLCNELRAMLGHLSSYRLDNPHQTKRELDKAYGHFRRFNIDALKILCNEFDRSLSRELEKQYSYDFRSIVKDYLEEYSRRYFWAKNLYLLAQQEERVGSDYQKHNLIQLYHNAAKEYICLKRYYMRWKKQIIRKRRWETFKWLITIFAALFGTGVTIAGYIIPLLFVT